MERTLNLIFNEIKKIQIDLNVSKKCEYNIFREIESSTLSFNGYSKPSKYLNYFEKFLKKLSKRIDKIFKTYTKDQMIEFKHLLHIHLNEVDCFKREYFPKEEMRLVYERITLSENAKKHLEIIKELRSVIDVFIKVQINVVKRVKKMLLNRLEVIENALKSESNFPIIKDKKTNISKPNQAKLKFDNKDYKIKWAKSKGDILLLIHILNKVGAFKKDDNESPTQTELFSFFSETLNFSVKNPENSLKYAKYVQKEDNSTLKLLINEYNDLCR